MLRTRLTAQAIDDVLAGSFPASELLEAAKWLLAMIR